MPPCKKVTKEDGIGEALTAKPIGTHCLSGIFPRLRAALPYVPLPALVEKMAVIESQSSDSRIAGRCIRLRTCSPIILDHNQSFDGGRVGVWGRRLKAGGVVLETGVGTKDFAVSASHKPLSLVHFLCGHKK